MTQDERRRPVHDLLTFLRLFRRALRTESPIAIVLVLAVLALVAAPLVTG